MQLRQVWGLTKPKLREWALEFGLSLATIHVHRALCKHLGPWKRSAKLWVAHHLSADQKHQLRVARQVLGMLRRDDPATSQTTASWLQSNKAHSMKVWHSKFEGEVRLIVFWDSKGVVLREFVPTGLGVNTQFYVSFLRQLHEVTILKCGTKNIKWFWEEKLG